MLMCFWDGSSNAVVGDINGGVDVEVDETRGRVIETTG